MGSPVSSSTTCFGVGVDVGGCGPAPETGELPLLKYINNIIAFNNKYPDPDGATITAKLYIHYQILLNLINFLNISDITELINQNYIKIKINVDKADLLYKYFNLIFELLTIPAPSGGARKQFTRLSRKRSQNISKKHHRHRKTNNKNNINRRRNTKRKH